MVYPNSGILFSLIKDGNPWLKFKDTMLSEVNESQTDDMRDPEESNLQSQKT